MSEVAGPVRSAWTRAPHRAISSGSEICLTCHSLHEAASSRRILRRTGAGVQTETTLCYSCHDGQGASSNVKSAAGGFAIVGGSGHTIGDGGLTDTCSSCHTSHGDAATRPGLPARRVNGVAVAVSGSEWCLACHDAGTSWYGEGYPSTSAPRRAEDGYPVAGTFPGAATYADPELSAHARIPAGPSTGETAGSCTACHATHRSASSFDGLKGEYRPSTAATLAGDKATGEYAEACFRCHGPDAPAEVAGKAADVFATYVGGNGHRISTPGGTLPVGAALPCYDCHNPHGSSRGNTTLLTDELGANLDPSTGEGQRAMCMSCHSTADGKVWDSASAEYVSVSTTATVEGLRRDGAGGSALRVPDRAGHRSSDTHSCDTCHGDSHNPTPGVSDGGDSCYGCHSEYQPFMEDGSGEKTGAARTDTYHHVLGGTAGDGDIASGSAPGAGTDVYCLSCHVDHDAFNADKGANLRRSVEGTAAANSDFVDSAADGYGVCVGCHSVTRVKDTADQKNTGRESTSTPAIAGADYASSAHAYSARSEYGDSAFEANCAKCHSDEQSKASQTSADRFGVHWSAESRLIAAFGVAVPATGIAEEGACFRCHSTTGNRNAVAGMDHYGSAWMSPNALAVQATTAKTYGHQPAASAGLHRGDEMAAGSSATWPSSDRHVECEDCHDSHGAQPGLHVANSSTSAGAIRGATGVKPAWGTTAWTTASGYTAKKLDGGADSNEAYLCLKCHSSFGGGVSGDTPSGGPRTDLALEFNPENASYHRVFGGLQSGVRTSFNVNGTDYTWPFPTSNVFKAGYEADTMLTCTSCHTSGPTEARGPHGSSVRYMIDPAYATDWDSSSAQLTPSGSGMASTLLCNKCHTLQTNGTWGNRAHERHDDRGANGAVCTSCHVGVPHGWKRPRLLGYTTDPAPYGTRAGGLDGMSLRDHTPSGWQKSDCSSGCHSSSGSMWP